MVILNIKHDGIKHEMDKYNVGTEHQAVNKLCWYGALEGNYIKIAREKTDR